MARLMEHTLDNLITHLVSIPAELNFLSQNYSGQWQASIRAPADSASTYPTTATSPALALSHAIREFHSPTRRMVISKAYTGPVNFSTNPAKIDITALLANLHPPAEPFKRRV